MTAPLPPSPSQPLNSPANTFVMPDENDRHDNHPRSPTIAHHLLRQIKQSRNQHQKHSSSSSKDAPSESFSPLSMSTCLSMNPLSIVFRAPAEEGVFSVLTTDIRKEIWSHIKSDGTFQNACQVNKRWNVELTHAWKSHCKERGFFDDLDTWQEKGKDWRWVVKTKTVIFTEDSVKNGPGRTAECNGTYEGEWKNNKKRRTWQEIVFGQEPLYWRMG